MARQMKDSGIEWIGEIPNDWVVVPLQYHADLNTTSLGEDTAPDYEFDYVEIGSVTLEGGINDYEHVRFADAPSRARRVVKEKDIIVSTVRTYLKAIAIVPARENVIVSTGFAVLTPKDIDVGFLGFFLKSEYFVNMVTANSVGISYPAINASDLVKFKILFPSVDEQQRIAAFLDRKCAEIDAVIERTKATIEEYKKLKQAVITEAVTKGVRGPRPMKDSGIEWIGEIPEGWEVLPHKYVMHKEKVICDHHNGEDIISLTMNGVIVRDLTAGGKMPTTFDGYQYVEPEDMLLCLFDIDVTPRCVGVVRNYGVTSPAYSRFKVHAGYHNAYYDYLLRFIDDEKVFIHLAKNLRSSLTETDFGAIKTIAPSYEEQREIAAYLDEKCVAMDTLIAKKTALLTELETYKKSLIYEYVTGKKEVN